MSDPYSRVYHRMADEYPNVFDDCRALGTWLRLLVLANAAWPMTPSLPGGIDRKALAILIGADLVELDGSRYRVRGMSKERTKRSDAARIGASVRHAAAVQTQSERRTNGLRPHDDGSANGMPSRDRDRDRDREETRVNETVRDGARDSRPVDPT